MEPALITLIINLVLGLFIIVGFLSGLRGIKKSTFGLVMFIIELIVVFFVSPLISNVVLGISISGKTINNHILDAVNGMLGEDLASTDLVSQIVNSIPAMVANIVVSIACIIVFALIFKVIGIIVYKLIFRKDKQKVIEKCEIVDGAPQMVKKTVKKKKYRLAGGLVGAVHGFVFACALFLPVLGVVNIFNDVTSPQIVSAETNGIELQYMDDILRENMPEEIFNYVDAINGSILYKVGTVGDVSEVSFNLVSKTSLNGKTIKLGEEIRAIVNTYNTFVDFAASSSSTLENNNIETIFNDLIENPNNYDFNKLYSVVDSLFQSNIVNAMGKDALKLVGDILVDGANDENSLKLITHIKNALYNYADSDHSLKEDIVALVGVFEISAKSGLLNVLQDETIKLSNLTEILLNDANVAENIPANDVLKQITEKLTGSYLLQKFVVEFANYGIEELEIVMNNNLETQEAIVLAKIDSNKDYKLGAIELENLVVDAIDVYEVVEGLDIDAIEEDIFNAFDTDIEAVVRSLGQLLNNFVNMQLLNETGVFASICDAMAETEYNQFISFEELKSANTISTQFGYLADSIKEIKNSGIINTIRYMDEANQNQSIDTLIDQLVADVDGNTYVSKIVSPILKCSIFKNTLEYALGEAHDYLEQQLIALNPNASLAEFNSNGLMTETENAQFIGVLNNLAQYLSEISIEDLGGDTFVETIVYSNLNNLGIAFDSIKASTLFADYNNSQGVYKDLLDALAGTKFSEFFDFSIAKADDFTWSNVTTRLLAVRTELDTVTIDDGGEQVKILKYIFTHGDYEALIDSLQGKTVNLDGVFEIDLIKPTSLKVINIINSTIKEFVGEELGVKIVDLDLTAKVSEQAVSINKVINNALQLDFNNIDINNLSDDDLESLNVLLKSLEENAKLQNNGEFIGVFKESYNALLVKVTNIILTEVKDFVGEELGKNITLLDANDNIVNESSDIINILTEAQDIKLEAINLDTIDEDGKKELNDLLYVLEQNAKSYGSYKEAYNALLLKTINLINDNIKTIVGDNAGCKITIVTASYDVINDSEEIRTIISDVIDQAKKIKNIDIANLNATEFFNFVEIFKNNTTVANGVFANTYNAMLVYIINTVNSEIAESIGSPYNENIQTYNGEINMSSSYNYIVEVVESANDAFASLEEGQKIEDVEAEKLDRFRTALKNCTFTQTAYDAVEEYLVGKILN